MKIFKLGFLCITVAVIALLSACGGDNKDAPMEPTAEPTAEPMRSFTFEIINTTHAQPVSPPALCLHASGMLAWQVGSAASAGLEVLAESGSPDDFIAEMSSMASQAGTEVILPGQSTSLMLDVAESNSISLTLATMLVNTNDAFAGVTDWSITDLAIGESWQRLAPIYDAGTEANTESAESIPGPAAGGEGFNAARNDVDFVARHPGVVTADDGLTGSALGQAHRFDNGAVLVKVTRTQ